MSFIVVILRSSVMSTFRFNILIYIRSLDVHGLSFFFLRDRSVDGDHIGPGLVSASTVVKSHAYI